MARKHGSPAAIKSLWSAFEICRSNIHGSARSAPHLEWRQIVEVNRLMNSKLNMGELAGQIAAAGKPYLGDIEVVDRQVRGLISGVVTRWGRYPVAWS